jgi:putative sporulation protein YyaC
VTNGLPAALRKDEVRIALHVYGTLSDPVHAVNMKDKLKDIQHLHKNPFIIAVDH